MTTNNSCEARMIIRALHILYNDFKCTDCTAGASFVAPMHIHVHTPAICYSSQELTLQYNFRVTNPRITICSVSNTV